jgi:hypothetical protein
MKLLRIIFPKEWRIEIYSGLSLAFILWVLSKIKDKSGEEIFNRISSALSLEIQLPIYILLLCLVLLYLFLKIKRTYFDGLRHAKIGEYKFKELYDILKAEFVTERTQGMRYGDRQPPNISLLEQLIVYYTLLSDGVDLETPVGDGGYVYGILCPKLHLYGLLSKTERSSSRGTGQRFQFYQVGEDGKKFWATLNKLSAKRGKEKHNLF